ncbi:MAG TPA: HD domain-containing phosphohydrolase [Longimicrobium sp.]|nr:HD domain-containing phosphohydrolase [Longimicrobium sp.]
MPTLRSLFRGPRSDAASFNDSDWSTGTDSFMDAEPAPAAEALLEMSSALLAALEARNDETELAGHAQRVAELADRMAAQQGVSIALRATLRRAALLHEVGMIGVPAELLSRTEPLTAEEMARVRAHAEMGAAIARATCGELGATLIRHQHDDEPTLRRVLGEGTDAYRLTLLLRAADVADSVTRAPGLRFVHQTATDASAGASAATGEAAEAEALAA